MFEANRRPNTVIKVDSRTPQEIITSINDQSRIVSKALTKLSKLLVTTND